jgi:hypothetical protein
VKTGLFRIASTLAAVASLVAGYFAIEFFHQTRTTAEARNLVTNITRSLLDGADAAPLLALVDDDLSLAPPDLTPLERFGELKALESPNRAASLQRRDRQCQPATACKLCLWD